MQTAKARFSELFELARREGLNSFLETATKLLEAHRIVSHPDPIRRTRLERWLQEIVAEWFGPRILPMTSTIAERWGEISARSQQAGHPLPVLDLTLAATAVAHGLTVVTRNTGYFQGIDVGVLGPWPS